MRKSIMLEIQQLGDKLVICIPAELARTEKLSAGQSVAVQLPHENGLAALSLEQKLAQYDAGECGGEVMAAPMTGAEIIR